MNIIYDYDIFCRQQYGGVSRYFFELLSRIVNRPNFDILLFLGLYINKYDLKSLELKLNRLIGVQIPKLPNTGKLLILLNQLLFKQYMKNCRSQLLHYTYYSNPVPDFKGKTVITVHDMIHELYPEYFLPSNPTVKFKKKLAQAADGIICVSQATKNDLIRLLEIDSQKIKVIHHGNSLTINPSLPKLINTSYILYVGQRDGYKNFKLLMKAFAQSPQINNDFKLICFGGGKFKAEEIRLFKEYHLLEKVAYYSGPDEILANLYKYAALLVYPSLYEGFGFPPLEAMFYGCPVVVSNRSSIPEVVEQAGAYFDPNSLDELVAKMECVLGDTVYRDRLIAAGRKQAEKFDWERCVTETVNFYSSLLD